MYKYWNKINTIVDPSFRYIFREALVYLVDLCYYVAFTALEVIHHNSKQFVMLKNKIKGIKKKVNLSKQVIHSYHSLATIGIACVYLMQL